jgi:hypothetical protein
MIVRDGLLALLAVFGFVLLPKREAGNQATQPQASKPDFVFRGRVLDRETLQPVPGIQVRRADGKVEVKADAHGAFAFPMDRDNFGACHWSADGSSVACSGDDPETTRFFLHGDGMSPMLLAPPKYRKWDQVSTLLVWRSASLHGVWLDADGEPVANRELEIESDKVFPLASEQSFADLLVTTDEKGMFHFDQIASRVHWSLRVANTEDKLVEIDAPAIVLSPGEKRDLTVRSLPMARVSGIVRDSKGKPRAEAGVVLVGKQGRMYANSATDGSFVIERVGAGAHQLKAMFPDQYDKVAESQVTTIEVTGREREVHADLELLPVREIAGRVIDAHGTPVGEAEIWFEPEAEPYSGRADVAEDGSFRLLGLFSSDCRLMASGPNRALSDVVVAKTGTDALDLPLEPTGRLLGRVSSSTPIGDAKVEVHAECVSPRPAIPGLYPGGVSLLSELEAGEGSYEFACVPCGRWRVYADIDGEQVSAESFITVDADKVATCTNLVLRPSADLWLVAAPAVGAVGVEVWDGDGLQLRTELADGRMGLLHVPAGHLRIVAHNPGMTIREQEVNLTPGTQQLVGLGFGN